MIKGFKTFILRGNAIDLAVGVVIGAAFGKVVEALVSGFLTPLVGVVAKPDFSTWQLTVNGSVFLLGDIINALIAFVLIAAAVYFFVVLPMNKLMAKLTPAEKLDAINKACHDCLSVIPKLAKRCAHCAVEQKQS